MTFIRFIIGWATEGQWGEEKTRAARADKLEPINILPIPVSAHFRERKKN
jgi:hypothetical protein